MFFLKWWFLPFRKRQISTSVHIHASWFIFSPWYKSPFSYCLDGEMESPSGYANSFIQWVSHRSGIQICHLQHPVPVFPPTTTQILSENLHSHFIFMSPLFISALDIISLVPWLIVSCWHSSWFDFRSWANIFTDKAIRENFLRIHLHSLDIPTSKHFWSRQYWHRFLVTLLITQFLSRWQV